MRLPVLLLTSLTLVACSAATIPTQLRSADTIASKSSGVRADLGVGDETNRSLQLRRILESEASEIEGGFQVFETLRKDEIKIARASGPAVTGNLTYHNFAGDAIPCEGATVHLQARGAFGLMRDIATTETDAAGHWTVNLNRDLIGKPVEVYYELGNRRWTIGNYRWAAAKFNVAAGALDTGTQALDASKQNAQAGLVHQVWLRALKTFRNNGVNLDWWRPRFQTNWPAKSNLYNFGQVNLTDAPWWDVNGHMIGHAIFFTAFESQAGSGEHDIDKCYSPNLAWSEGWASFFSAVISLPRDDMDAKFEFMEPRFKPVHIENIPADVCYGLGNEWRVCGALWDLYDTHDDGTDRVALDFKTIWEGLSRHTGVKINNVADAFDRIAIMNPLAARQDMAAAFRQSGISIIR